MGLFSRKKKKGEGSLKKKAKDFFRGLMYESYMQVEKSRRAHESMLMTILFGDELGLPMPKNIVSLILLKFYINKMEGWKKRVLKEKDIFSKVTS